MQVLADNIPSCLRSLRRWVCWCWVWNPKKHQGQGGWEKPLFDPRSGQHAKSTTPATWTDFVTALRAHQRGDYDGIGITLGHAEEIGHTLAGVDLDDVRDPRSGEVEPWAELTLKRLDTYAEVSPSRTGIKATCWGQLPTGRRNGSACGVEMYDGGRYWTVTGHRLPDSPAEVMDRASILRQLHAELLGPTTRPSHRDTALTDRELALSALAALAARRAVPYGDWLAVGMALHSVDPSGAMLAEWERWSGLAPKKFEDGACARKWASFGRRSGWSLGSLIYWAQQDGWHDPRGRREKEASPAEKAFAGEQLTRSVLEPQRTQPRLARTLRDILRGIDRGDTPCV
jgi:hypothetical protein